MNISYVQAYTKHTLRFRSVISQAYQCLKNVQGLSFSWSVFSCIRTIKSFLFGRSSRSVFEADPNNDYKHFKIHAVFTP